MKIDVIPKIKYQNKSQSRTAVSEQGDSKIGESDSFRRQISHFKRANNQDALESRRSNDCMKVQNIISRDTS